MKKFAAALLLCALIAPAAAAKWNVFLKVGNDNTLIFFDADTVVRKGDTVLVWIKYMSLKTPDSDGSWATAERAMYSCSSRKVQVTTQSIYDNSGNFMRSIQGSGRQSEIVPGTLGEGMMRVVCGSGFPRGEGDEYVPIAESNTAQYVKNYREYLDSRTDKAPQ